MTTPDLSYQMCSRCIMDTSDPNITFDAEGVCSHCHRYQKKSETAIIPAAQRDAALQGLVARIKRQGAGKRYDCLIGVSGGVDSTYTAFLVKQLGLRPLAVHLDNGWNSEMAVANIESVLRVLGIDLYTHVLNWEEFRNLQISFLKASTPDSEVPSDHAIVGLMRRVAAKEGIRYILLGCNFRTEGIMPKAWSDGHGDWHYIRSVHRRFLNTPLSNYPHYSIYQRGWYQVVLRQKLVYFLDYFDYDKKSAMQTIEKELGYRKYDGKHYESIYTRFFQAYILPKKFGFDKRRAHLSTLVNAGQMSREEALQEMKNPPCAPAQLQEDYDFVIKKLNLSEREFEEIMNLPKKKFWDYPSYSRDPLMKFAVYLKQQWF